MKATDTNVRCRVCDNTFTLWDGLCRPCVEQRDRIAELRRQKKRDAEFGNLWIEAGVLDD